MLRVLIFLLCCGGCCQSVAEEKKRKLVFLTWEDFISPSVVSKFEREYNATLEFVYFQHDEERDALIASEIMPLYDVYIVDGQSVTSHKNFNWMAPMGEREIPNFKLFNDAWKKIHPDGVGYVIPYGWGTFGIAYRADKVKQVPRSLKELFNPVDELKGKITMSPQMLELFPSALLSLGYDMNSKDLAEIGKAETLIYQQKPFVHSYQLPELNEKSLLISSEVVVAQTYNGDAMILAELNENIRYLVPEEGSPMWIDFLAVSADSKNKALAYQFVNFLSRTDVILENMQFTYTASFNDEANKRLPAEMRNDPMIFHPMEKLYYYREPDPRAARKMMGVMQNLEIQ
ncbi:Spermidine-binding periplasmic protein SpuE [Thalassocella blandensis]|nr:Spermidine-binding periplasmic protein SpuE [Thalassocella blandensis]